MKILILLAHPAPGSLNHAIAERVGDTLRAQGHEPDLLDLYASGFDPLLPPGEAARGAALPPQVGAAVEQLSAAEGIVIVHPNWWGMPPAALVGWVDRVVRVGSAYRFQPGDTGEGTPIGLLRARRALVLNTSDTYPEREEQVLGLRPGSWTRLWLITPRLAA